MLGFECKCERVDIKMLIHQKVAVVEDFCPQISFFYNLKCSLVNLASLSLYCLFPLDDVHGL